MAVKNNYRVFYTDQHRLHDVDVCAKDNRSAVKKAAPAIERAIANGQLKLDWVKRPSVKAVSGARLAGVWWDEYCDCHDRAVAVTTKCAFLGPPDMDYRDNPRVVEIALSHWAEVPMSVKQCLKAKHPDFRIR